MNPTIGGEPGPQDTTRLMVTALLLVGLFAVWNTFFLPKPDPAAVGADGGPTEVAGQTAGPQPGTTGQPTATAEQPGKPAADAPVPGGTPAQPVKYAEMTADVAGHPEQTNKTVQGGYTAQVTNQGAQISKFILTGYDDTSAAKDKDGNYPPYNIVNDFGSSGAMVALQSRGGEVPVHPTDPYEIAFSDDTKAVFRRQTAEGVRLSRTYTFDAARFGFTHELTLKNDSNETRVVELDLLMSQSYQTGGGSFLTPSLGGDAASCRVATDQDSYDPTELKDDGPQTLSGPVTYAAGADRYFLNALLPENPTDAIGCKASYYLPTDIVLEPGQDPPMGVSVALQLQSVTLKPGEAKSFRQKGYFGPKQLQLLESEGSELDENIEFGIFGILSKPILWLLVKLYDATGNFGFAIILLTLIIKLLTFPLTQKSYVSMQQMKTLAPELKKLQEKYAHDRAQLGQKQMEMYKEKGINPLAGCFPMLVQMPIWFALYRTLWTSVELYQKPFFGWINDLSQPDVFPLFGFALLPFFVGALMLFQTMLQPPPQDQPQMKYVLWAMPIMFTVFMFGMPSGLSVYMITNSSLTMVQQLYIKKKYGAPATDDSASPKAPEKNADKSAPQKKKKKK